MSRAYYRPIVQCDVARPRQAITLAQGWGWFTHVEVLHRGAPPKIAEIDQIPPEALPPLRGRPAQFGERPHIMGILNATPDSFSDGGLHAAAQDAVSAGLAMAAAGADILDVGGESTRPGAETVAIDTEIRRIVPVVSGLRARGYDGVISLDTRKAEVARAGIAAGADLINDVSGFTYDPALAGVAAQAALPVCVMHGPLDPAIMQNDPRYDDVILDVYDFLEDRIAALEAQGIAREKIIADPGIGFGKTQEHNLQLLARLSLFHSLGVPILLGASRKRFIGTIGGAEGAADRAPGSIAVGLAGLAQGVQILRVHDVAETAQAIALWRACVAQ
ncbi:dihydropteroate synthase [Sulfitobacter donghicola]|uniref:Dihydropteroate synthase n=1 Tax=Sulfitobacter donghicola DSW-25 = KCTC 12864 = JCM 14565 TaxID=1300350 RepID=A0A073IJY1_9RHOB|nr:dihydropteroate synthase [Sulfitobacter donghicola]KEJ90034.1 dihydropteroate synthase [Sulfitobacter donghicola DSW-25 = KCTC 12864 = JCM 14565]KIN66830.1 Dihydropteroate synthase, DHPS [Sulfitobacter donghicola DSW-25 = KCTC 12864 = JCM 14565]